MGNAIVTAFGTASSSATLPVTINALEEKNKVDSRISRWVDYDDDGDDDGDDDDVTINALEEKNKVDSRIWRWVDVITLPVGFLFQKDTDHKTQKSQFHLSFSKPQLFC